MGVAYFIVLDNENPGFGTLVDGKAIARDVTAISKITSELKIADINDLTSFAAAATDFGVDPNLPGAQEKWFAAAEGLDWVRQLKVYIAVNPKTVTAPERILSDLDKYDTVLQKAASIKARWHFEMDF